MLTIPIMMLYHNSNSIKHQDISKLNARLQIKDLFVYRPGKETEIWAYIYEEIWYTSMVPPERNIVSTNCAQLKKKIANEGHYSLFVSKQ